MKLEYINDRKGKFQSHEIRMIQEDTDNILNANLDGYGDSILDALNEYEYNIVLLKSKLDQHINDLISGNIVLVNRSGNEITEEIKDNYYTGDISKTDVNEILRTFIEGLV